jgi:hypothetical protein
LCPALRQFHDTKFRPANCRRWLESTALKKAFDVSQAHSWKELSQAADTNFVALKLRIDFCHAAASFANNVLGTEAFTKAYGSNRCGSGTSPAAT